MKYYYREITKRVPFNRYGVFVVRPYLEVVYTDHIEDFNYRKRIKFKEMPIADKYRGIDPDTVYEYEKEW